MAVVETFACDVCGVHKQKANRWWRCIPMSDGIGMLIVEWDCGPLGIAQIDENKEAHLCGENHVFEYVSKKLTKVS